MLYPQIPSKMLEIISGELSINLGTINLNLKNKLNIVTNYIKKYFNVFTSTCHLIAASPRVFCVRI